MDKLPRPAACASGHDAAQQQHSQGSEAIWHRHILFIARLDSSQFRIHLKAGRRCPYRAAAAGPVLSACLYD